MDTQISNLAIKNLREKQKSLQIRESLFIVGLDIENYKYTCGKKVSCYYPFKAKNN